MLVPSRNRRKTKTKKELRRQDALGAPSKDTREPLRIVSYTKMEKNPQSVETVLMMAKYGERWLRVSCSNRCPAEMCSCALAAPRLSIT